MRHTHPHPARILRGLAGLTALAMVATLATGCDSGDSSDSETSSRMTLQLTDAPGDTITAAVITVSRIYLVGDSDDAAAADASGHVVLSDKVFVTDLIALHNDVETLVTDVPVPDGRYHQLRFVIDGAYVEAVEDGEAKVWATAGYDQVPANANVVGKLKTPSWSSSGLKVKLPDDRIDLDGEQKVLVVDFDVAESFQTETGNGDWVMRPNLTATELTFTGTVDVDVAFGAALAVTPVMAADIDVILIDRDGNFEGALPLADIDLDGDYEVSFRYLTPSEGPFTVELRADDALGVNLDVAAKTAAVPSGERVSVSFDVTSM